MANKSHFPFFYIFWQIYLDKSYVLWYNKNVVGRWDCIERDLVLYNPQIVGEPLFIEFKRNVFVGSKDQIKRKKNNMEVDKQNRRICKINFRREKKEKK